jgi:hypothetical protein
VFGEAKKRPMTTPSTANHHRRPEGIIPASAARKQSHSKGRRHYREVSITPDAPRQLPSSASVRRYQVDRGTLLIGEDKPVERGDSFVVPNGSLGGKWHQSDRKPNTATRMRDRRIQGWAARAILLQAIGVNCEVSPASDNRARWHAIGQAPPSSLASCCCSRFPSAQPPGDRCARRNAAASG